MKQITLVTNHLNTGVTIFPKGTGNLRAHRWNRNRRNTEVHEENIVIKDGDTLFFADDNWYHLVDKDGVLNCHDISDGMIGARLLYGTHEELNMIRTRIMQAVKRLELYPCGMVVNNRLEITLENSDA